MKRWASLLLAAAVALLGPLTAFASNEETITTAPPAREANIGKLPQTTFTALEVCAGSCPTKDTASGSNSGDGFFEGELEVDGGTDLDGTLDVAGAATFATSVAAGSGANTVTADATGIALAGTARATAEIFVPAGDFVANAGSGSRAIIGSANAQGWALDADSDESISAMFKVPDGFGAANATCYIGWSSTDTGAADAVFDVITVPTAVGEDSGLAGNTDSVTGTDSATADALNEDTVTIAASTEWAADDIVYLTINRDANNVADSLTADASVHYFRCTFPVTDVQ